MNAIKNNPYRILGLLAGASIKEQSRQISRLKKYIDAEQETPTDDYSFPVLGSLIRTTESIEEAASVLNLDRDKVNAALFWFWNGNPITDEVAFEALKENSRQEIGVFEVYDQLHCKYYFDIESTEQTLRQIYETRKKEAATMGVLPEDMLLLDYEYNQQSVCKYNAFSIWQKLIDTKEITERNASAFQNISTLMLISKLGIENGIALKLKFLESDFVWNFIPQITDETYKITKQDLQLSFLNSVSDSIDIKKILRAIKYINFSAKADYMKNISRKYAGSISVQIETAKKKRIANKSNAATAGEELYRQTKNDLEQLKSIVGVQNFAYSNIADKVANEILQCSIDFFNYNQDINANNDYHNMAVNLAKLANRIAVSSLTKGMIKENIDALEEMQFKAIQVLKIIKQRYDNLGLNKTINEHAVVDLIQKSITQQDVNLIMNSDNQTKRNEYKTLVNFLMTKLSPFYKGKINYLVYWSVINTPTQRIQTVSSSSGTSKPITSFSKSKNAGCYLVPIITVVGAFIGVLITTFINENLSGLGLFLGGTLGWAIAANLYRDR